MKIRLTENDLARIVKRVLNEQPNSQPTTQTNTGDPQRCKSAIYKNFDKIMKTGSNPTIKFIQRVNVGHLLLLSVDSREPCWIKFNELNLSNNTFTAVMQ